MHTWPPVQPIYSLHGLTDTQTTAVQAVVQLCQALPSEVLTVRDDQSVFVPPETGYVSELTLMTGR